MNFLICDVETTTHNKGNPFDKDNKLCYTGFIENAGISSRTTIFNHVDGEYRKEEIQSIIDKHTHLVAFNAKFDCHWLENIGIDLSNTRIWDCQYAEFLMSCQLQKYPSLETTCQRHGLESKIDVVKTEYWEKGIDTLDIPPDIMVQYLHQDLNITNQLFKLQQNLFKTSKSGKWRLFQLHMEDQVVLREMEHNGILYDVDASLAAATNLQGQIAAIDKELTRGYENIPINWNSGDHLSAYLYGGTIEDDVHVPVGVFKTGKKIGQTRYKIVTYKYELPQLFKPIPKSELAKEGYYATDKNTLNQLRGNKEATRRIGLLNERAKLEKLRGTYYQGFPKTIAAMGWSDNYLHSTLNQCVAVTGRLSSTRPNQQNMPPECKQLCISRFL